MEAGPSLADHRQQLREVVAEERRGELRLAGAHPVAVAPQGVDLAVVRDQPVGVRELPAREGVRGVAGVDEREGALDPLVREVGVEAFELRRGQHPLVDDPPRGEARHDEVGARLLLDEPPDHVELPLERVALEPRRGRDHGLPDRRHDRARGRARHGLVPRHVAPGEEPLPLRLDGALDDRLHRGAPRAVARQEEDADAVPPRWRQRVAEFGAQERVRDLEQDSRAVAGLRLGTRRAAVLEVLERRQRTPDGLVPGHGVETGDRRDPAGVVLVRRVVETGGAGSVVGTGHWLDPRRVAGFRGLRLCGLVGGGGGEAD
jgi:hypothetical protein